jgi:Tfp pilus assembly protein PilV
MSRIIKQNNKGFTLLEALVAISILMVAVAAPITIAQKGLSSAVFSKDQMIASYLAQDAIEFIKNRRDVATINDENFDWDEGGFLTEFVECLGSDLSGDECQIDTIANSDNITAYSASRNLIKDNNGFYQYEGTEPQTKFNRKVVMSANRIEGEDNEILVTVTVSWGAVGNSDTTLQVKTLIYNY